MEYLPAATHHYIVVIAEQVPGTCVAGDMAYSYILATWHRGQANPTEHMCVHVYYTNAHKTFTHGPVDASFEKKNGHYALSSYNVLLYLIQPQMW